METQGFGERVKRTSKKIMKIFVFSVLIIGLAVFSFMYWATYEDGVMAGKVLRISQKGVAFKTYEGKINLETFGALKGTSPIAESFDFSVEKSEQDLIKELEQVALSGERVNLYFIKRYVAFPWRGDTKYFATRVERLPQ
jgi:predicted negative regulator of RcsB-dependent stress response